MLQKCKYYFKRECLPDHIIRGIIPLPFASIDANFNNLFITLKEKELELRAQDQQGKTQLNQQDLALKAQDMQQEAAFTQQKIQATQQIAAEKADIARERLAQTERAQLNEN